MEYIAVVMWFQLSKSMNIICEKLESFSKLGRFIGGDVCELELAFLHPGRARFLLLSFTSIKLFGIFLLPFTRVEQLAASESLATTRAAPASPSSVVRVSPVLQGAEQCCRTAVSRGGALFSD